MALGHVCKTLHAQTVNTLKQRAILSRAKPFISCSGTCPILTFVLRAVVSVQGRWWVVDAWRGTAQGRMSIITYWFLGGCCSASVVKVQNKSLGLYDSWVFILFNSVYGDLDSCPPTLDTPSAAAHFMSETDDGTWLWVCVCPYVFLCASVWKSYRLVAGLCINKWACWWP